ncbi:type II toxin-antitoxin system PemK/MazF family toxin [Bacillus sp. ISL-75]|uniref:type II toxin-antitoxin system PemK/MazF family toxin n=1 Tax=Bacillus sp. ISL-75 TaxID=2819137 RepID=UPI001BE9739B|nr:type II toxin-antitoxin system PemK/MazF family toxin [Bacillus sp. ISL-75]MBT2730686.1 type II toxin-antitoxin system PemK/MazF family toxin [Bacillus sp. ISL-75]
MTFKKHDIVLVPFPFSDKPGFKKRPAVIISNEEHYSSYGKYICLAITCQEKTDNIDRFEHKLHTTKTVGLLYDNQWVLPNKVFSIEERIIHKQLGTMDATDFEITMSLFNSIL